MYQKLILSMPPLVKNSGKSNAETSLIKYALDSWAEIRGNNVYISITDRYAETFIQGKIDNNYFYGIISYKNFYNASYRPEKAILGEFKFDSCVIDKNY